MTLLFLQKIAGISTVVDKIFGDVDKMHRINLKPQKAACKLGEFVDAFELTA